MAVDIVARDEELRALGAFLDRGATALGPSALALEGEPGIGKSTLWLALLEEARARGRRVLVSRPAESERGLAHAGLGDLFDGVLDDVLPGLPAPRRRALEAALLVGDPPDRVDPRALGVAVRGALERLAAAGPLLVAIDDLQWLDGSSAAALGFALRRLEQPGVLLAWTRRLEGRAAPTAVEAALDPDRVERIRVGPLSVGAVQGLLRRRLGRVAERPALLRLHEVSGGNPFYALELARALGARHGVHDPTRPLPIPERLEELVSARLAGFTGATHDALVLVSAQARLTPAQLAAAGVDPDALDPALSAHVLELVDGAVRFTHPLLASVLYQGLPPGRRQGAHRRLAELADDPLVRAGHLAGSTDRPDAALAAEIEAAASAAEAQGAPLVAAELCEHALRLTPSGRRPDVARRASAAARAHLAAGESERARSLAAGILADATPGGERAEALALMADVESEDIQRSIALLGEALGEAAGRPALEASIHHRLSLLLRFTSGVAAAERHALAAVELAERAGDAAARAAGLAGLAIVRFNAGAPGALALAEQAHELAAGLQDSRAAAEAGFALAHVLVWSAELERARALLERVHAEWEERDERLAANALWYLALVELRAGRLALAGEYAERVREVNAQYARDEVETPQTLFPLVLALAHRGELERARELAQRALERSARHASRLHAPAAILALVDLWSGDVRGAVRGFADAEAVLEAGDGGDPDMRWWRAEQVEALLELGRVDEAVERLDEWETAATRLGRSRVLADATRCRGLVAAARGEVGRALALLADAVARHEAVGDPFGRARALLALGVLRRRARQKRPAREAIEAAVAGFEEIGAARWAERAREELGRIGGRTRSDGLTPAERRVADLVARGQTNAEVAAALFLAERTVASHLTHVYAKLGVRSRTELARRLR